MAWFFLVMIHSYIVYVIVLYFVLTDMKTMTIKLQRVIDTPNEMLLILRGIVAKTNTAHDDIEDIITHPMQSVYELEKFCSKLSDDS